MDHRRPLAAAVVTLLSCTSTIEAGIHYRNLGHELVRGSWKHVGPGDFRVSTDMFHVDFDENAAPELNFIHTYIPETFSLSPSAVERVQTAESATAEIRRLLSESRSLALEAAGGTNSTNQFALLQSQLDNRIDAINQIAAFTTHNGRRLLDGSAGFFGFASDSDVSVLRASANTLPGTYSIEVTTSGARATISAFNSQTAPLSADEILVVNGVAISLRAGLTQSDVINRINEFYHQTNVIADANGLAGATRLYTGQFGTDQELSVTSNMSSAASSSGFGTTELTDVGSNVIAQVDGNAFFGSGDFLQVNSGPALDLSLRFAAQSGANSDLTVLGAQGSVSVVDGSLEFLLYPDGLANVRLSIPSLRPSSLGIGVEGSQFNSLNEIGITSQTRAMDSLQVIDESIIHVDQLLSELADFLQLHAYPDGEGFVEASSTTRFMLRDGIVVLLEEGELIGPLANFSDESVIEARNLRSINHDPTEYLGLELVIAGQIHYGWLGIEIDEEFGFLLRDLAIETTPGMAISAGAVPEPHSLFIFLLACLPIAIRRLR